MRWRDGRVASVEEPRFEHEAVAGATAQIRPRQACGKSREAWQLAWLEHTLANFRYALRQWRKRPGFAAVVVVTLGLGIGANSAVFSAIDAIVLRPLPFPEGERLMRIHQRNPRRPSPLWPRLASPTGIA
jgi:hypothetical protein